MSSGYPSGLTASAFEMLIHYFWSPIGVEGEMEVGHRHYKALQELNTVGLVIVNDDPKTACWKLTTRGTVLARHLLNTRLPESKVIWYIEDSPVTQSDQSTQDRR